MRRSLIVVTAGLILLIAAHPALAATSREAAVELLGGTLGGIAGVGLGIAAIGSIAPNLEARAARVATVISAVTLSGGLGAAAGVLVTGKILDARGNAAACLLGGLAGGLVSACIEPLLYLLGVPEGTTEFLGLALLPIVPAAGATIGFNRSADPG